MEDDPVITPAWRLLAGRGIHFWGATQRAHASSRHHRANFLMFCLLDALLGTSMVIGTDSIFRQQLCGDKPHLWKQTPI